MTPFGTGPSIGTTPPPRTRRVERAVLVASLYVTLSALGLLLAGLVLVSIGSIAGPLASVEWPLPFVGMMAAWTAGLAFALALPFVVVAAVVRVLETTDGRAARRRLSQTDERRGDEVRRSLESTDVDTSTTGASLDDEDGSTVGTAGASFGKPRPR